MLDKSDACHKHTVQPHKDDLLKRLKRIEGQVRGVHQMIENDRYCIDVLTQISALRAALNSVALQLVHDHMHGCVQQAIHDGNGDKAIDELIGIVKKLT